MSPSSSSHGVKKSSSTPKNPVQSGNKTKREIQDFEGLIAAIDAAGIEEFVQYIRSPWKMLWPNFVAGIARGVGALIGAVFILGLVGWFLSNLITLPLIGEKLEPYIDTIQTEFNKYSESVNYKTNFLQVQRTLEDIKQELKK